MVLPTLPVYYVVVSVQMRRSIVEVIANPVEVRVLFKVHGNLRRSFMKLA